MNAVRLAVWHPDPAAGAGIAARLRGAAAEPCADLVQFHPTPGATSAVLLGRCPSGWPAEVERLFGAGAHVLLVADPCPAAGAVEGLSARAREAGVQFAVVNPDRYRPSRQLVHKQLSGPLGAPGLIRIHRWEPVTTKSPPGQLVLDIDLTLWLTGSRPDRVYAVGQDPGASVGGYVQIHLGFPGGCSALLGFTSGLPDGDGYRSLSVIAFGGAAYADDHQNTQLLYRGGHPQAVRTEERAGQLAAIAQEFVDALRDGRDLTTPSEAAWRDVFAVNEAVGRSLATRQAVTL